MFLGIDYGRKRIGLALGESIPYGAGVVIQSEKNKTLSLITEICNNNDVEKIVIGIPKRLSGDEGELGPEIREFAQILKDFSGRPVEFEEEQFSSLEAESILKEQKIIISKNKEKIDELAAILILEQYLNHPNKESH